jgi:ATP-binding cassette subfamily B protein
VLDYKRFEIQAREQSATIQLIQGMQEIKLNGIEKQMRWAWEGLQARLFTLGMKGLSLNQWQQAGAFFVNEGKNIIITFLAAKAVIDGQMTLGSMLAVQYIIGQLNSPIEQMIGFAQSWQNAKISMDRLNEIHTMEDEEPESKEFQYNLPAAFAKRIVGGGTAPYPPRGDWLIHSLGLMKVLYTSILTLMYNHLIHYLIRKLTILLTLPQARLVRWIIPPWGSGGPGRLPFAT